MRASRQNFEPGQLLKYHIKTGSGTSKRWTYKTLARQICCHEDTIGNWVRGKTMPTKWDAENLAKAFGLRGLDRQAFVSVFSDKTKYDVLSIESLNLTDMIRGEIYKETTSSISRHPLRSSASSNELESYIRYHLSKFELSLYNRIVGEQALSPISASRITSFNNRSILGSGSINNYKPITIDISPENVTSRCMLDFIIDQTGIPIRFKHTLKASFDIMDSANKRSVERSTDAIVMSFGQAIEIYKYIKESYYPVCIMPGFSVGIATRSTNTDLDSLTYIFPKNASSGAWLSYRDFGEIGKYMHGSHKYSINRVLNTYDSGCILGFPYWNIMDRINCVRLLNAPDEIIPPSILFLRNDIYEAELLRKVLIENINYSWITMSENSFIFERHVNNLANSTYISNAINEMGIFM